MPTKLDLQGCYGPTMDALVLVQAVLSHLMDAGVGDDEHHPARAFFALMDKADSCLQEAADFIPEED